MNYEQRIINLIESDESRMRALHAVKTLDLPDWLIAAGFVRNIVWHSLYGHGSELTDIDVIYYCTGDTTEERDLALERQLNILEPEFPWSVKNQARMHLRNRDSAYKNTLDAMGYWPEKQTAIGVQIDESHKLILRSRFGLDLQFNGQITHNPARSIEVFNHRVQGKQWLKLWPELQVKT